MTKRWFAMAVLATVTAWVPVWGQQRVPAPPPAAPGSSTPVAIGPGPDASLPVVSPVISHPHHHAYQARGLHRRLTSIGGAPENFVEPPLGAFRNRGFGLMIQNAAGHDVTFNRSDFLPGSAVLSPSGEYRLQRACRRLAAWTGPVIIEAVPDDAALGLARKTAVLNRLVEAGAPAIPEQFVVGTLLTPGLNGTNGDVNYQNMLMRYSAAGSGTGFPPPPQITTSASVNAGSQ